MQTATIGGGCFWCVEAIFTETKGVIKAVSGYSGGQTTNPTYEDICRGDSGHAEVVQVSFDEQVISYEDILNIFFSIHDPTTPNRQGSDIGEQYRSIIYYENKTQQDTATNLIQMLNNQIFNNKIVTAIEPLNIFYKAEEYHQNYFKTNPSNSYCQMVIAPKIAKFRNHNNT